jgi:hypothetical protein
MEAGRRDRGRHGGGRSSIVAIVGGPRAQRPETKAKPKDFSPTNRLHLDPNQAYFLLKSTLTQLIRFGLESSMMDARRAGFDMPFLASPEAVAAILVPSSDRCL